MAEKALNCESPISLNLITGITRPALVTSPLWSWEYRGAKRVGSEGQFEDELYAYASSAGLDRHSPSDLAQIVREYGCQDEFSASASLQAELD